MTYWIIGLMEKTGLAWNVVRKPTTTSASAAEISKATGDAPTETAQSLSA